MNSFAADRLRTAPWKDKIIRSRPVLARTRIDSLRHAPGHLAPCERDDLNRSRPTFVDDHRRPADGVTVGFATGATGGHERSGEQDRDHAP